MISTEMKKQRNDYMERFRKILSEKYDSCLLGDNEFYKCKNGGYFQVNFLPGEAALVIEYAESANAALQNQLEDGDSFYIDDMPEDELFANMLKEIG